MINLKKGQNLNLSETTNATKYFRVGLGWNMNQNFDLDVFSVICDTNDKGLKPENIFYYHNVDGSGRTSEQTYGNLKTEQEIFAKAHELISNSVVVITKDNQTGEGDGDDETLFVNPNKLNDDEKIKIIVNIYESEERNLSFGMISEAFVRILDDKDNEVCRYDLAEDFSIETGVIVGEFEKINGELKFKALGKGFKGDINNVLTQLS